MPDTKLIVVSNRLPVAIFHDDDQWRVKPSPGGLVTALAPTMQEAGGLWIGWPGCTNDAPADRLLDEVKDFQFGLRAVLLSDDEISRFYDGLSNKTLWPLFHDLLGHFSFDNLNWQSYVEVNRRFAEKVAENIDDNSTVWIHDYHLLLVGKFLREMGVQKHLGFFLHIPFPSPDLYRRLPVGSEVIESMLEYDHLGFQTASDRRNFVQCVKWFAPDSRRSAYKRQTILRYNSRDIKIGYYPISIDFNEFNNLASDARAAEASWYLHENVQSETLMLGLDRLDYTKGIPERFLAFERALEKYEDLRGKISLIQVVVPSRLDVTEYKNLKAELDSLSGRINGRFTQHGWIPIHYQFRELDRVQLVGHYRACQVALVTPLRDGMNLVAKEYCASQIDGRGVLVLSEFAGAAQQLHRGALLVNPYDIDSTADAIYQAHVMNSDERTHRMKLLRAEVKRNDVRRWVRWFLTEEENVSAPHNQTMDLVTES